MSEICKQNHARRQEQSASEGLSPAKLAVDPRSGRSAPEYPELTSDHSAQVRCDGDQTYPTPCSRCTRRNLICILDSTVVTSRKRPRISTRQKSSSPAHSSAPRNAPTSDSFPGNQPSPSSTTPSTNDAPGPAAGLALGSVWLSPVQVDELFG